MPDPGLPAQSVALDGGRSGSEADAIAVGGVSVVVVGRWSLGFAPEVRGRTRWSDTATAAKRRSDTTMGAKRLNVRFPLGTRSLGGGLDVPSIAAAVQRRARYATIRSVTLTSERISATQAPTSSNARIRLRGEGI